MKQQKFSLRKRIQSFVYAFQGLRVLFLEEHNARIHLVAAAGVVGLGWFCRCSTSEWTALVLAIGLVITAEALNSAIENLADFVSPERNDSIKRVKDLAAAAVLISAIAALVVGLLVFVPKMV
ncbi:MAG TPA: diacylglycerol kinase [Microscillaceae bacterium]|jgi:undecaprenol kinase/diacylglycerol kinase (ATP)|nr:diacylglycerol kinase [Microscillaceae bacterium]